MNCRNVFREDNRIMAHDFRAHVLGRPAGSVNPEEKIGERFGVLRAPDGVKVGCFVEAASPNTLKADVLD